MGQIISFLIVYGIVVYVLMLLPLVGTVLAPLLGAVVATITMHELEQNDKMMHDLTGLGTE